MKDILDVSFNIAEMIRKQMALILDLYSDEYGYVYLDEYDLEEKLSTSSWWNPEVFSSQLDVFKGDLGIWSVMWTEDGEYKVAVMPFNVG